MQHALILIVEDEEALADVIRSYLSKEGYNVKVARSGSEGLQKFHATSPDLVILDLMLPDVHGEEVCRSIRQNSSVPIIMLTARSSQDDRIRGLSLGADDYLVKPFSPRELALRVNNVLKRVKGSQRTSKVSFNSGSLIIDSVMQAVIVDGEEIGLTASEFKLLTILADAPRRPHGRDELISKVQGYDYLGFDRVIDAHIKNLRRKLGDDRREAKMIQTVYGVGYKFGWHRDE